ncbi:MAG TPA: hypothetical protein PLN33_20525 [Hyphomonadaceae bacterium]|nr:hypothetical protein [Hyphomonadaceae bacterium]HPN06663.1 hypothetical protein [Hyphomonadaceae bacterium]
MKLRLAFASVLALSTAACASGPALEALTAMQIIENNAGDGISYAGRSGSGGNLTLRNVTLKTPASVPLVVDVDLEEGAAPVVPSAPAPAKSEIVARAETLTFTGLDMKAGKPVFTGMVARGVTPVQESSDEPQMKIGSIGIEGMNAATGAFIAGAFTKEGPGQAPPFEQWAFKNATVKDVVIAGEIGGDAGKDSAPDSTPNPTGSVKFEMGELTVANVKDKMIGLTRFGGIKGDINVPGSFPVAGVFDLGTLDITNIRAGMFSDAFAAGMGAADGSEPDWGKVFAGYTSPLEAGLDGIKWSGMSANFSGLKIEGTPTSYTTVRNADGVVVATKVPLSAFKLTADSEGGSLGAMGLMLMAMGGYPSNVLEVYSQGEATFDPGKDLTRYESYTVGVTDIAEIKVAGGVLGLKKALPTLLTGLMTMAEATGSIADEAMDEDAAPEDGDDADSDADADAEGGNPLSSIPREAQGAAMQMVMALITLQVTDLDISITDKQLVKLLLNQLAPSSGQSVEAYRQDLVNIITGSKVFMTDAGVEEALAAEVTTAVAGFLSQPGTLRIQIKPKTPFGAMSAMMGMPTKESLGFSATFTPLVPQS